VKTILCIFVFSFLFSCTINPEAELITQKEKQIVACSKEAKMCPDGQVVGRNPKLNCQFDSCTKDKKNTKMLCTTDVKQCPDGKFVGRDANNNCQFPPCGKNLN